MSTLARINQEAEGLPNDLQKRVLAYVELLKYKSSLAKAEKLTQELGGIGPSEDDEVSALLAETGDEQGGDWAIDELQEKIAIAERVHQVLVRMKNGKPGITTQEMRQKAQQWKNR